MKMKKYIAQKSIVVSLTGHDGWLESVSANLDGTSGGGTTGGQTTPTDPDEGYTDIDVKQSSLWDEQW